MVDERDVPEPLGNNQLSAYAMFEERKYYKDAIYPGDFIAPKPFDLWYNRHLFGKVNFNGTAVFAPRSSVKQLENNVWAQDFVVDAFNDFKTEFLFLNKKAVEGTPYALLTPSRGWTSAVDVYDEYMDEVYELFVKYIEDNKAENDLVTFGDFMDVFYQFINDGSPNIPATLSQFILSRNCPVTTSGLMIDISTDTHGNDRDKFNHFLNNTNFICFAESAERFGFKVDKNFPGRLIADINSPVMNRQGDPNIPPSQGGQGYMLRYPKEPKLPRDYYNVDPTPPVRGSPPKPAVQPSIPFETGDKIVVATVKHFRPSHRPGPINYYMLRDHTELKNRHKEPGWRQKRTPDGSKWYDKLSDIVKAEKTGDIVPIYGKVIKINPSEDDYANYIPGEYHDYGHEVALIEVDSISFGVGTKLIGSSLKFNEETNSSSVVYNMRKTAFRSTTQSYAWRAIGSPENVGVVIKTYIIVPLDAIHLKSDNNPFVVTRFKKRVDYTARTKEYHKQLLAAMGVYNAEKEIYDNQTLPEWNRLRTTLGASWDFYDTANPLSVSNIFNRRFTNAYLSDIYVLKNICMQFYYSYVRVNPTTTLTKVVPCGNSFLSKRTVVKREQITQDLINEKYSEKYWFKQYILFQNAEAESKFTFDTLRIIRRRALEIYDKVDPTAALKYIRKQMSKNQNILSIPAAVFKKRS
jgi:hypothetical protein